jgi:O-acetyl-ADP-ribose deacetylase (regulator of RNase III)
MPNLQLVKGDITQLAVDAIVNAANRSLLGGGGVDGAIHRAAGPDLLEECRTLNGCNTGEAKITKAYRLKAKFIIHTVGPIFVNWLESDASRLLRDAYVNSMRLAVKSNARAIAFPNISTGAYGYPKEEAAPIAIDAVMSFLEDHDELEKVVFCCYDEENYRLYLELLQDYL